MLYFILFLFSFILTYFIKEHAIKKSLFAEVNERSSHTLPTPHGGGIALGVSWFFGLSYLFYIQDIDTTLYYTLMGGTVIAFVSYLDDRIELSPKIRLIIQALLSLFVLYMLGGFKEINMFYFTITNPFITNIFAFFLIIWFINLYNFLDGIDGYAGSEALFLSLSGYIIFGGSHFLVLAFSMLGFLVWNWQRAKIFMGDVGSTLLGYNIAVFTLYYANEESLDFWVWIILFGLFWFDATLTLLRRYKNKEKISQAHKKHAYQRLTQSGYSHSRVVIAAMFVNLLLLVLLFFINNILLSFLVTIFILYILTRYIDRQKGFD